MANKNIHDIDVTFVKGIGPARAALLNKELGIYTVHDLLHHFPANYLDRTSFKRIKDLIPDENTAVQIKGRFVSFNLMGEGAKSRYVGLFSDGTSTIEIVWFRRIKDIRKIYVTGKEYVVFGAPKLFNNRWSMVHPEIDSPEAVTAMIGLRSVYALTEKLRNSGITSRTLITWMNNALQLAGEIEEILPQHIVDDRKLMNRNQAIRTLHFPVDTTSMQRAKERMKYEELFFLQLDILRYSLKNTKAYKGYRFNRIGEFFNNFYNNFLPFPLTDAQKKVIKEIRADMNTGRQMNRLLQGDVGSGKTLVALLSMIIAIDNGMQACMMAPTEILARQHYTTLRELAAPAGITIELLTGSTSTKERNSLHSRLESGEINILVGTHALIEETVKFKNLGIAVIDEQHRFGVVQRARLWKKNPDNYPPHVLVMTATPIPRTLAMTVYGDLDVSVIDKLPPGRKPVKTLLRYDNNRLQVYKALGAQLAMGRQAYIVYPLIEESRTLDLKSLEEGYEIVREHFPHYKISMVHGKMKPPEKDWQMQQFASGKTHILVATTVIEVGVNVPNANTMIIENAERFGLSQLHQLRGRVGRGADQSFCILMAKPQMSKETRQRLEVMTSTTDGFLVAEADLKFRGPGDLEGTMQSGIPFNLKIASLATDGQLLQIARNDVNVILEKDPELAGIQYASTKKELSCRKKTATDFGRIS